MYQNVTCINLRALSLFEWHIVIISLYLRIDSQCKTISVAGQVHQNRKSLKIHHIFQKNVLFYCDSGDQDEPGVSTILLYFYFLVILNTANTSKISLQSLFGTQKAAKQSARCARERFEMFLKALFWLKDWLKMSTFHATSLNNCFTYC